MIVWLKGSAFNFGNKVDESVRLERFKVGDAWKFMVSDSKRQYLHVDDRNFYSVPELNEAIDDWVHRNKKLTI